jgi:hypothetical protein
MSTRLGTMLGRCFLALGSLFLAAATPYLETQLPNGWRLPSNDETAQSWRLKSLTRYLSVSGDFAGRGAAEKAIILVKKDGTGFAPYLLPPPPDGQTKFFQAEKISPMRYLQDDGLRLLPPGNYKTTCGKGYGCSEADKDSVTVSTQAVEIFQRDGPERLNYWNNDKGGPSEVWLSD